MILPEGFKPEGGQRTFLASGSDQLIQRFP
jgi:hypothetical protein